MKANELRAIIKEFLDGTISAEVFADRYDQVFRRGPAENMDRALFNILEDLWEDQEAYSPLWLPEDIGPARITAETLRQEAEQALLELEEYLTRAAPTG